MPLAIGPDTERTQRIVWNPCFGKDVWDAKQEIKKWQALGFTCEVNEKEGEAICTPPARNPNHFVMRILSENGDDRLVWDRTSPSEVKEAFSKFQELIKKGYKAFSVKSDGKKGHAIDEFDPLLQEVMMGKGEVVMVPSTMPG